MLKNAPFLPDQHDINMFEFRRLDREEIPFAGSRTVKIGVSRLKIGLKGFIQQ